jgi:hypothetical protein
VFDADSISPRNDHWQHNRGRARFGETREAERGTPYRLRCPFCASMSVPMAKRPPMQPATGVPRLAVPRSEVTDRINALVREAGDILARPGPDSERQQNAQAWQDRVLLLLKKWFTDQSEHNQFRARTLFVPRVGGISPSWMSASSYSTTS